MSYPKFHKINRLYNEAFSITEKIDGTNGLIYIESIPRYEVLPKYDRMPRTTVNISWGPEPEDTGLVWIAAGSRSKWISPDDDNHGFAKWVYENADSLAYLKSGYHYGEWAGPGINGNPYGLKEKTFFLFNWRKWYEKTEDGFDLGRPTILPRSFIDLPVYVVPVLEINVPYHDLANKIAKWTGILEYDGSLIGLHGKAEGVVVESSLGIEIGGGQKVHPSWKYFCGGEKANATRKGS